MDEFEKSANIDEYRAPGIANLQDEQKLSYKLVKLDDSVARLLIWRIVKQE